MFMFPLKRSKEKIKEYMSEAADMIYILHHNGLATHCCSFKANTTKEMICYYYGILNALYWVLGERKDFIENGNEKTN